MKIINSIACSMLLCIGVINTADEVPNSMNKDQVSNLTNQDKEIINPTKENKRNSGKKRHAKNNSVQNVHVQSVQEQAQHPLKSSGSITIPTKKQNLDIQDLYGHSPKHEFSPTAYYVYGNLAGRIISSPFDDR